MTLDDLIKSPDTIIADAALLTSSTIASFNAKQITAGEYAEIMHDILDFDKVIKLTADLTRQNKIAEAFSRLTTLAGAISSLVSV
jgi:hypothetical protein